MKKIIATIVVIVLVGAVMMLAPSPLFVLGVLLLDQIDKNM